MEKLTSNYVNNIKYRMKTDNDTINNAKQIELEPMDDSDIRYYFPDARILSYDELYQYDTIDDLLPKPFDAIFLLYLQKENYGHWCLLSKYDNTIEMFNSYGDKYIDEPLYWTSKQMRQKLGVIKPHLRYLLENTNINDYDIIFNGYDFQDETNDKISTCGRWCVLRLKTLIKNKMSLSNFIKMMKDIKQKSGLPYDIIVSDLINKT
jgi:hypothetical protein